MLWQGWIPVKPNRSMWTQIISYLNTWMGLASMAYQSYIDFDNYHDYIIMRCCTAICDSITFWSHPPVSDKQVSVYSAGLRNHRYNSRYIWRGLTGKLLSQRRRWYRLLYTYPRKRAFSSTCVPMGRIQEKNKKLQHKEGAIAENTKQQRTRIILW